MEALDQKFANVFSKKNLLELIQKDNRMLKKMLCLSIVHKEFILLSNLSNTLAEEKANHGYTIASKLNLSEIKFIFLECLVYNKLRKGDFDSIPQILEEMKKIKSKRMNVYFELNFNLRKGIYLTYLKDIEAGKFLKNAVAIAEKIKDREAIIRTRSELLSFYIMFDKLKEAEDLALYMLKFISKKLSTTKIFFTSHLGVTYRNKGNYQKAVALFKSANKMAHKINIPHYIHHCLGNLAIISFNEKKYNETIGIFKKLLSEFSKEDHFMQQIVWLKNLGICYLEIKQFKKAVYYYNEYIRISAEHSLFNKALDGHVLKAFVYLREKNHKKIIQTQKELQKIADFQKQNAVIRDGYEKLFRLMIHSIKSPGSVEEEIAKVKDIRTGSNDLNYYFEIAIDIINNR